MIQFKHKVKIFYRDIDKMGIVYYSRYYEYFEEARTEMLDSIGLSVTSIENYGIQLPVISSHCDYKKGAKFEQKLVVDTSISELPRVRLKINYLVHAENSDQILVIGNTVHAFINENNSPTKVPKLMLEKMEQYF
tara:strand:- start:434 stop:838 length:405 start_codon:yes stop_codon:yes gene_type:complete